MPIIDLRTVSKEDFDKYMNTEFLMPHEAKEPLKLELIESKDKSNEYIDGFSLAFLGKFDTVFPQKTYTLSHSEMGEVSLFLVPFSKDEKGVYYEAIFSRLKNKK